ncbi:MAG: TRAP transporter large permease [Candidatus Magnetomorum sp.]|nr:TRAP transporter large permease [Candidatus Magnetomorum sp.]
MSIIFCVLFMVFALFGEPLFIIMGGLGLLLWYLTIPIDGSLLSMLIDMKRLTSQDIFIAIPLFTFCGYVLSESNTPARLTNLVRSLLGWAHGGLAVVTLVTCAFFSAFTGASGVTIIALGGFLYPILINEKYPEHFSLGLVSCTGGLGLLFPPSLPIILYGIVSSTSIDDLFLAALLPGIFMISMLSIYAIIRGKLAKVPTSKFNLKEATSALWEVRWEIPFPFIIIIGIYGGLVTASQASALVAFYAIMIECFIYKDISFTKDLPLIMKESMVMVGGILIILASAMGLTAFLIDMNIPDIVLGYMKEFISNKYWFLFVLNIFLLIVGCMMDIFSAIIVVVPLIMPIATAFDIHPIHLGIIFLMNLEIGYMTPPVGINLFISSFRFNKPVVTLYRSVLPFLLILFCCLLVITYFPFLSLWLLEK